MPITNPLLPPIAGYVEVEVDGVRQYKAIEPPQTDTYSTGEQVVGVWIDGRPIYRKVIVTLTSGSSETSKVIANIGVTGINKPIRCTGLVNNWMAPVSWGISSDIHNYVAVSLNTNGDIYEKHGSSTLHSKSLTVICEYTKTADEAPTAIPDEAALNNAYDEGVQSA